MQRHEGLGWVMSLAAMQVGLGIALVGASGCSTPKSTTDLNPAGPPMVRQVFAKEVNVVGTSGSERIDTSLAFGDHPSISLDTDDRKVDTAVTFGNQRFRIVFDELLVGNALEEIACFDGTYSKVPVDATPDDIFKCAGKDLSKCKAVCIGPSGPVGVLDANFDGAPDQLRMIDYGDGQLGVILTCDGTNIPLVAESANGGDRTYYDPSGNQQLPAGPIGIDGLGPAIVVYPTADGLRTGARCSFSFRPEVTDKDGNKICAPPNGDVKQACPGDGDTSLIDFGTEALKLTVSDPADGSPAVSPVAANALIVLQFDGAIDVNTISGITLKIGATVVATTIEQSADSKNLLLLKVPGGFAAATTYTVTLPTTLADIFGGKLPETSTVTFTTSTGTPTPDAGPAIDAAP